MGLPHYDRTGRPITSRDWQALVTDGDYRVVARTEAGPVTVSTVWVGIDHQHSAGGPPLIFETAVFDRGGPRGREVRYATEEEALAGHLAVLAGRLV
ncbi:hypothetical protein GCM10009809_08320 [Isoptericola hypogeus]|uniref:Uncharacterized protein n=1 Tax=Isoptericola hypogeus TaxID=300179 RepID=A0ABN2IYR1_9MICO